MPTRGGQLNVWQKSCLCTGLMRAAAGCVLDRDKMDLVEAHRDCGAGVSFGEKERDSALEAVRGSTRHYWAGARRAQVLYLWQKTRGFLNVGLRERSESSGPWRETSRLFTRICMPNRLSAGQGGSDTVQIELVGSKMVSTERCGKRPRAEIGRATQRAERASVCR